MSYGLKYQMNFSDLKGNVCRFDISQRDYFAYDPIILRGTESPVVVEYEAGDTDVLKPVRGCSATVNYINERVDRFKVLTQGFVNDVYSVTFEGTPIAGDIATIQLYQFAVTHVYSYEVIEGDTLATTIAALLAVINATVLYTGVLITDGLEITAISGNPFISPTNTNILLSDFTGGVPLAAFFSEDDQEFYGEFFINNDPIFKGYLVQDDCSESFNAAPYPVQLKFNDNLGLLTELTLSDTILNLGVASKESIASFLYAILQLTGLDLPLEIYNNVFEERMDDRNDDPANDAFIQSFLKTASFKEESYKDCFTVLEELLKAADCVLFQAKGSWVVMRWPELPRFANDPPGSVLTLNLLTTSVEWHAGSLGLGGYFQFSGNSEAYRFAVGSSFSITDSSDPLLNTRYTVNYITLDGGAGSDLLLYVNEQPTAPDITETVDVTIQSSRSGFNTAVADNITAVNVEAGSDLIPIEFTQLKSLKRGYRYVQRTFDYKVPDLIANQNLSDLGPFISTSIDGDFTYNDYGLIGWNEQEGQDAFVRVVIETATGDEKNRYIVMTYDGTQSVNDLPSAAIITPKIEVGATDKWKFSCRYRASEDFNDTEHFGVSFYLRPCAGGSFKRLTKTNNVDPATDVAFWSTYIPFSAFDPGVPPPASDITRLASVDKAEWADYSASTCFDPNDFGLPAFPYDGTLEIGIYGKNDWNGTQTSDKDAYIKDIRLEYFYFITDSTQIAGQIHTATNNPLVKNVLSEAVFIDDAPRQNIGGTIYLDQNETCSVLSARWKTSSDNPPDYRFGQIQSIDRLGMNQKTRNRIEGDFYMNVILSMKDIITFGYGGFEDSTFITSRAAFDYRNNRLTATFDEAWNTEDADASDLADFDYNFKFKFKNAD